MTTTTCRCGHGRQWHRQAPLSGWQRSRGERSTKTVRCEFGKNNRYVARCRCRDYVPLEA